MKEDECGELIKNTWLWSRHDGSVGSISDGLEK